MDSAKQRGDAGKMLGKGNKEAESAQHAAVTERASETDVSEVSALKHEANEMKAKEDLSSVNTVLMSFCSQSLV